MKLCISAGVLLCLMLAGASPAVAQSPALRAAADAMTRADQAFNQSVQDGDRPRFLALIADKAIFSGGTPQELHGRDAVNAAWAPYFEKDGPKLAWKPTTAEALGAGDTGYTVGTWERRVTVQGVLKVAHGNYLTVWRKQDDGVWRVVYDTGSTTPE